MRRALVCVAVWLWVGWTAEVAAKTKVEECREMIREEMSSKIPLVEGLELHTQGYYRPRARKESPRASEDSHDPQYQPFATLYWRAPPNWNGREKHFNVQCFVTPHDQPTSHNFTNLVSDHFIPFHHARVTHIDLRKIYGTQKHADIASLQVGLSTKKDSVSSFVVKALWEV